MNTFFVRSYTAINLYDELVFNTDQLYNRKAPEYWVSWMIASFFTLVAFIQYVNRFRRFKRLMPTPWKRSGSIVTLRTMISCYIDMDDPLFVITKFSAQSFWFLGGMQLNYAQAFSFMMQLFAFESILDSLRVILAYYESQSLEDYIPTSDAFVKRKTTPQHNYVELQPTNVYEDLTRSYLVVLMVFVTQVILIGFVALDIHGAPTMTCPDGTAGCPVTGTLGSWSVYVLGIFMALVYLLGPKTAYGNSEQNPAFWLRLLLTAKQHGAVVNWYDPLKERNFQYNVRHSDWRLWLRFFMSFLVNGVGFHILVHALPIQVAAQNSFLMVVFRSVGMMHLVDMDDTSGYILRLQEGSKKEGELDEPAPKKEKEDQDIAVLTQKIIDDAKAKLDALAKGKTL